VQICRFSENVDSLLIQLAMCYIPFKKILFVVNLLKDPLNDFKIDLENNLEGEGPSQLLSQQTHQSIN